MDAQTDGKTYHWTAFGDSLTTSVSRRVHGSSLVTPGHSVRPLPKISALVDYTGSVATSFEKASCVDTLMLYTVNHLNAGTYSLALDVEFKLDSELDGGWDFSEPWTLEINADPYIQTLGQWVLRNVRSSGSVARILADVVIRTLATVSPKFKIGFRCAVARPAATAWVGFRMETYVAAVGLALPPSVTSKRRLKKRRPPKTLG